MNFWESYDIELLKMRKEVILIIEEFEMKHNSSDKNYRRKLNNIINSKIGKKVNNVIFIFPRRLIIFTTVSTYCKKKRSPNKTS